MLLKLWRLDSRTPVAKRNLQVRFLAKSIILSTLFVLGLASGEYSGEGHCWGQGGGGLELFLRIPLQQQQLFLPSKMSFSEIKCAFFSLLLNNYRCRDILSFWWRLFYFCVKTCHVEVWADSSRLEHGVASLTGSYSMAVRPLEEHPHGLHRKWNPKLVF